MLQFNYGYRLFFLAFKSFALLLEDEGDYDGCKKFNEKTIL